MMGMLLKVYMHGGWRYVKPLGNINPCVVASFPFGRAQYKNDTEWQDEVTGRYVMPKNNDIVKKLLNPIHGTEDGLLMKRYKTANNQPDIMHTNAYTESILYGSALTIRIKPGQFAGYAMILCVLYGAKGIGGRDEMLAIAVQNLQIVTYYRKNNADEEDVIKRETGIYLNNDDRWSSIGLNFSNGDNFGLAGVYHEFSYINTDIFPMQEFNYFWLFGLNNDTWLSYTDENGNIENISDFNGGIAQVKIYNCPLNTVQFDKALEDYNDNDDKGVIFIDKPSGGLLTKIYTESKFPTGSGGGGGDTVIIEGGGGGSAGSADIGDSGTQDPLG